jgi:hypothetical protein
MLKRPIKYENFNGDTVTEDFYFNLTRPELMELEVAVDGGFGAFLKKIATGDDNKAILEEFQRLIISSYGEKSEDGRTFKKSDEIHSDFRQSAAYDALFFELGSKENALLDFIIGIFPSDMRDDIRKAVEADDEKKEAKPTPPLPPGAPT